MEPVTLARHAMATRFELVLHGANPVALRAAGEAALDEIERLEGVLSLYRPSSEIANVNALAADMPVRVSVPVFRLIQQALELARETGGAFDVTIGPLMRCWGFMADSGRVPNADELAEARARVGWQFVELDPGEFTVRFGRPGMMLDLGAIGKGYAIDMAVDLLREAGVESALIHGGTSSIYAIGHPPEAPAWKVAVRGPEDSAELERGPGSHEPRTRTARPHPAPIPQCGIETNLRGGEVHGELKPAPFHANCGQEPGTSGRAGAPLPAAETVPFQGRRASESAPYLLVPEAVADLPTYSLRDMALSVSAVWGKSFQTADKRYGHVIDPRTGQPAGDAVLAAVSLPSTTETDALSTALLTLGRTGVAEIVRCRPEANCLVG